MQIPDDIMVIARLCSTPHDIATAILFERQVHVSAAPRLPGFDPDIEGAKKGGRVIIAITGPKSGKMVLVSEWLQKEGRFNFIAEANTVVGWMPYPEFPEHLL